MAIFIKSPLKNMSESCCNTNTSNKAPNQFDHKDAIQERYGSAAQEKESCLCTPVGFNPVLLEAIPQEVIERDYGCGDPTKYVQKNDIVLDLGSGSGKNAFICAQIVGKEGKVIGVDQNPDMLSLSRSASKEVTKNIGFNNTEFLEGSIEKLDELDKDLNPLIADKSVDIILSNCVLNLVSPESRSNLLRNIKRVLNDNGRIAFKTLFIFLRRLFLESGLTKFKTQLLKIISTDLSAINGFKSLFNSSSFSIDPLINSVLLKPIFFATTLEADLDKESISGF